jgi:Peptidase C13 family/Transposase DDE domain
MKPAQLRATEEATSAEAKQGRNAEVDFHCQTCRNDTHASTSDPDARLYRKGNGKEAKLCHMGHAPAENRSGLIVETETTTADGHAERQAALLIIPRRCPGARRLTLGAGKGSDSADFVGDLRKMCVTPHVAAKSKGSAIDRRTTRHQGYAVSQRVRKRIEEAFGWGKTVGGIAKTMFRGTGRVGFQFTLNLAAYNLARLPKLSAANWFLAGLTLAGAGLFGLGLSGLGAQQGANAQGLPPPTSQRPAPARVHIAAFGLWGEETIFKRETIGAARALQTYFAATGKIVVRANTAKVSEARVSDMREQLKTIAADANRESDILVLFMTSHGTKDGVGIVTPSSRQAELLSPRRLGRVLKETPIRHKIVIISACYSGVFANALADDTTLLITAADADHPSFGCGADVKDDWTYFGRAFFVDGLKAGRSLDDAFKIAKARVLERESAQKFEHSNPQMRGGKAVRAQLEAIRAAAEKG